MNLTVLKTKKASNLLTVVYVTEQAVKAEIFLNECLFSLSKQNYKSDLLIIHSGLNEELLLKLKGIADKPTITLNKTDEEGKFIQEKIESDGILNYVIEKAEVDTFAKIFNTGFNAASENGYELYTIVEHDDVVALNWFEQANSYIQEKDDTSIFVPLTKQLVNGVFSGFMNEICWAERMAEVPGNFDMSLLTQFNAVAPLGAIYKIEDIKQYAEQKDGKYVPFKESMKLTNSYEFFLRMVYNDLKVITIPRLGYELRVHSNKFEKTSAKAPQNLPTLPIEQGGMPEAEIRFYLDLAKKEYFFDEDREKVYESQS